MKLVILMVILVVAGVGVFLWHGNKMNEEVRQAADNSTASMLEGSL